MRKRKKSMFHKNKKYGVLWILLVIGFFIFGIFSFSFPWRGVFQDFSVSIGKFFTGPTVNMERYDRDLLVSLREENEQLRDLLGYKDSLANYEMIPAMVVYRTSSFEDTLIVDCGKKDGVSVDMAVVTEDGLIGKVEEVYSKSSLVRLLTDTMHPMKVSVSIHSNEHEFHGVLDGYDASSNTFLVTSIEDVKDLELGSKVISNGLGNVFPSGIEIGAVSEVTTDALGISFVVKVETNVNFQHLGYLFILGK